MYLTLGNTDSSGRDRVPLDETLDSIVAVSFPNSEISSVSRLQQELPEILGKNISVGSR